MTPTELDRIIPAAEAAVRRAGERIRADFGAPRDIRRKGRIDLVTATDMAVEAMLKDELSRILPGAAFLAEETAGSTDLAALGDAPCWIIDPLDGTTNFAHGLPMVCTSVALWLNGRVELGFVNAPVMDEFYSARRGGGAFVNGERIRVSGVAEIEEALLATGFPYALEERMDGIMANLRRALAASQGVRRPGSAAIDLAWTARGRFDGFWENGLKPWDVAAGWLLVEEAGGVVGRFAGGESAGGGYRLGEETVLAATPALFPRLKTLLEWPSA